MFGSIVTLCATSMGAGVLSLPKAMAYGGWAFGFASLAVYAILSDYSLMLLLKAGRACNKSTLVTPLSCVCIVVTHAMPPRAAFPLTPQESIGRHYMGRCGAALVKAALLMLLFGGMIALLIVVGDELTPALQYDRNCTDVQQRTNHITLTPL